LREKYIFTSESVSPGHPDKVADQISDAILDAALVRGDETTRVAVETLVTTNHVTVAGEVKNFNLNDWEVENIIRSTVARIGYEQEGFHWRDLKINNLIHSQSADIALGTDDFGAGDQGLMFGYACDQTPSFMPAPIHYAHEILKTIGKSNHGFVRPDAKCQVSMEYNGKGEVERVDQVVVSLQHEEGYCDGARKMSESNARRVLGDLVDDKTVFHLNPTGNFVIGGPDGDVGLTGRKIIVDTYGGYAPHGGGAFSGKDPTKVDRSAAYLARWMAKYAVKHLDVKWCQVQLSYAIGVKEPTSLYVDSDGDSDAIEQFFRGTVDMTPKGIIDKFDLMNFREYSKNCVYGHFGDKQVPWERV